MKKLINYLYQFDRRPTYAIYGIENDFGFGCMDKVSIAVDLGFTAEQSGIVQNVVPHPFRTIEEVENFPWNISLDGTHTQAELEMVKKWFSQTSIHQGGGSFGPLTVAACILGIQECTRMVHKKPDVLHAVLQKVTDYLVLLAKEEAALGADSYWIAEPVASLLSPKSCQRFCTPYIKTILQAIDVPGVLHVCGNTDAHTLTLLETGAQALSIDWCTNLPDCLALAPDDVVIMGNISPTLLWEGSLEEVRSQTELLLEQTRNYKNFVLATGCQVPSDAPYENVQLMVDLARQSTLWSNDEYRIIAELADIYCTEGVETFSTQSSVKGYPADLIAAAADVAQKRLNAFKKYAK